MKRLSIALAAIGLSAGAFAALPAATDPTVVNVPQLPGGFVVGVTGYYLQPSSTNGDLDYASVNTGTTTPFSSDLRSVDPSNSWGWGVNVGYIFPNTGNDVNLSYFHLSTSDTDSAGVASTVGYISSNGADFSELSHTITGAASKAEYDLNQVDLTAGQFINVGCRLILHPNAGLRWAQLQRDITSVYVAPTTTATQVTGSQAVGIEEKSDFSGIGPVAGIDASYYIGMGFGAVGHFDTAVLVGRINSDTDVGIVAAAGSGTTATSSFTHLDADNITRVVPVVDAKLGLDYTYVFNNAANSDLTLEAGWMFSNYSNSVDRLPGVAYTSSAGYAGARSTSDVGLNGPYASLVFHA